MASHSKKKAKVHSLPQKKKSILEKKHEEHSVEKSEHKSPEAKHHKTVHEVRPKPQPKPKHEERYDDEEEGSTNIWLIISLALIGLLIASVMTGGFRGQLLSPDKQMEKIISDLNNVKTKQSSEALGSNIDDAIVLLEDAKEQLAELKTTEKEDDKVTGTEEYGSVKLDFYVMSQCPYGTMVEDGVAPALEKLGDSVDFNLNFILYPASQYEGQEDVYCVEGLCSMHGVPEVEGDMVQLCAAEHEPDKYMNMIVCMNENSGDIPDNWESCAEENGLDVEAIRECYEGEEGLELLDASGKKAEAVSATGSPTMYLDDEAYTGGRDELSFTRALCAKLDDHPACEEIPECGSDSDCTAEADKIGTCVNPGEDDAKCEYADPVEVEIIVLNDDLCDTCDPERINEVNLRLFKGAVIRDVDFESEEGQELYEKYDITYLPAYIFGSEIEETNTWITNEALHSAFVSHDDGTYRIMSTQVGSVWNPIAENCNNGVDDRDNDGLVDCEDDECSDAANCYESSCDDNIDNDGNGKTDCEEDICKDSPVCMEFDKPTIDFFVMSYCPYGNQAEEGIAPVYEVLKDDADFNVHYIYYAQYNGGGSSYCFDEDSLYCSMHGVQEANQNVREQCVAEKYGMGDWFKFALAMNDECNSGNADTCWEAVAEDLGYDVEYIKTCQEEKDEVFAAEDSRLMTLYGARGSPAVYINGASYSGGRSPAEYRDALCATFEGDLPEGCSAELSSDGSTSTGSC